MSHNDAVCDLMAENGNLLAERDRLKAINAQLVDALEYVQQNIDEAIKDGLITAPLWYQAQLGECSKMMNVALNSAKGE